VGSVFMAGGSMVWGWMGVKRGGGVGVGDSETARQDADGERASREGRSKKEEGKVSGGRSGGFAGGPPAPPGERVLRADVRAREER
jgi:hypothetical protein